MTNKKLGLLLLPLLPLSAIGIVEVASRITPSQPGRLTQPVEAEHCQASVVEGPATRPRVWAPPRVSAPPAPVATPVMPAATARG